MKVTYYAAMSSDGFIARQDGDVSWLDDLDIDYSGAGYEDFFASVDGLVMGRGTYDFIFGYGAWPYEEKPTWVCTNHTLKALPGASLNISKSPQRVIEEARQQGLTHLWLVGGGKLASAFLDAGLLTHLFISEMPITLSAGVPLFSDHTIEGLRVAQQKSTQQKGFKQLKIGIKL